MDTQVREAYPAEIGQVALPPNTSVLARLRHPVIVAIVLALAVLAWRRWQDHRTPKTVYVTQPVTIGSLEVTVTASGNLEPRNQVEIGSELSGTVRQVNVDVNDNIAKGQVLASLDTSRLEAQLVQAQSAVTSAEARIRQTLAKLTEATARSARLLKLHELSDGKLPSEQDMDAADAALV